MAYEQEEATTAAMVSWARGPRTSVWGAWALRGQEQRSIITRGRQDTAKDVLVTSALGRGGEPRELLYIFYEIGD
jgi:hypothetical protein